MRAALVMFADDDSLQGIAEWLVYREDGPHVCDSEEDPELCKHHTQTELLKVLTAIARAEYLDESYGPNICDTAVPGICPEIF